MKSKTKGTILLSLLTLLLLISTKNARASEGIFELRNIVGGETRCFATSILLTDQKYHVLVSCRDIIYPGGTDIFSYILWANRADGRGAMKLGELGVGKVKFETQTQFASLFVTKEVNLGVRDPQGQVIMQGSLQKIAILDLPQEMTTEESELGEPEASPTPTIVPARSTGLAPRMVAASGALAFIALVGVITVVFVITRKG